MHETINRHVDFIHITVLLHYSIMVCWVATVEMLSVAVLSMCTVSVILGVFQCTLVVKVETVFVGFIKK